MKIYIQSPRWAVGIAAVGIATTVLSGASPAHACPAPAVPLLDCQVDTTCCVGAALAPDADATGARALCDEAFVFQQLQNSCPGDFDGHELFYDMDVDSWSGHGWAQCNANTEFGKHWMASGLFSGLKFTPGVSRNLPVDYLMVAGANATTFHPQHEHHLDTDPTETSIARRSKAGPGARPIRFYCPAFVPMRAVADNASTFVHESWHGTYGSHDLDGEGTSSDYYYPKRPQEVPDAIWEEYLPDPWLRDDADPHPVQRSVWQIQHDLLCDLVDTPRDWVPRSTIIRGQTNARIVETSRFLAPTLVPAWATCGNKAIPARTPKPLLTPDRPRTLTFDVYGAIAETSEAGVDDDTASYAQTLTIDLTPMVTETGSIVQTTVGLPVEADGEVWVDFAAVAVLGEDGDVIDGKFNVFFYEKDNDGTNCDEDLVGDDCPGIGDTTFWQEFSVQSTATTFTFNDALDNASNENGTDTASVRVDIEMSW